LFIFGSKPTQATLECCIRALMLKLSPLSWNVCWKDRNYFES
jgi:hypothetical protein